MSLLDKNGLLLILQKIKTLLSKKVDTVQGVENYGKVFTVNSEGNADLASFPSQTDVVYDETKSRLVITEKTNLPGNVSVDPLLLNEGDAADAKVTGDRFNKLSEEITDCIKSPVSAAVGQTIKVSAVDESGKPTEWEAVDMQEQVQPDWNQNDRTAADYVKNRTHWTEEAKNVLLEEQTLTIGDEREALCNGALILEVGKTYTVNFNGTEYECVTRQSPYDSELVIIGNGTIMDIDDVSNNEPFIIGSTPDETILVVLEPGDYTVSISHTVEKNHKLDEKYLPEGCLQQSDYTQFNETASDYIKNRPFYDDIFNKTLTFTNVGTSAQGTVLLGNDLQLIDGETYTVTVNDESFSTEAVSNDDGTIIYLHRPTYSSIFNNVIICKLDGENSRYEAFSWWSSGSTVSISGKFRRFKRINNKYLKVVTTLDGQTGDITLKNTSAVTHINAIINDTYPRKLITAADKIRPYALDLGTTVLLGNTEDGVNLVLFSKPCILKGLIDPTKDYHAATKHYVDTEIASAKPEIILKSSTEGSTKEFKITVDDSGAITATEVTE